jgi:hypothetical protein
MNRRAGPVDVEAYDHSHDSKMDKMALVHLSVEFIRSDLFATLIETIHSL